MADLKEIILKYFPYANTQNSIVSHVKKILENKGYNNILLSTSCCPDELNRDLDTYCSNIWGQIFYLGGLAGLPFTGKTGFGAYMNHVPENGAMLIICASHIGLNNNGEFGFIQRCGISKDSLACGSAIGAYNYLKKNPNLIDSIAKKEIRNHIENYPDFNNHYDYQQNYVLQYIASKYREINTSKNEMVTLSTIISDKILTDIKAILPKKLDCDLFILSGIQINIENQNMSDYFVPRSFIKFSNEDLTKKLLEAKL